jgi:hypothetical protein
MDEAEVQLREVLRVAKDALDREFFGGFPLREHLAEFTPLADRHTGLQARRGNQ